MKKIIAITIALLMVLPFCFMCVSAEDGATTALNHVRPDWLITEVVCNTQGNAELSYGYNNDTDPFEAIEIYNNSGRILSLYDYCLTYNGTDWPGANFQNVITEITPFLTDNVWADKPGNYIDGSTKVSDQMPTNPQTCDVEAGEIVVLWVMYHEAYNDYSAGTGLTGLSVENFRAFHSIPDTTKVIAVDGNSSTTNGGHDKNFNVKNSATGTYGLALYSDELNTTSNKVGSTTTPEGGYRGATSPMAAWASVDYKYWIGTSVQNTAVNFIYDYNGASSSYYGFDFDSRNMQYYEGFAERTLGKLLDVQKITNPWYDFEQNEEVVLPKLLDTTVTPADEYGMADTKGVIFEGWTIDGASTILESGTTYKVPVGTHTFASVYTPEATEGTTAATPGTTAKAPDVTTPKADDTTAAAATPSVTTAAPTSTTKAPEPQGKTGGCGKSAAYVTIIQLVAIIGGAAVFALGKKK